MGIESVLIAKYDKVTIISTVIDSNGNVEILLATTDETLSTDSIKDLVGEALEEEYGQNIEVAVNVKKESEENEIDLLGKIILFVSDFWLFIVIGISFLLCTALSIIAVWRYNKKNKFKKNTDNLNVISVSPISESKKQKNITTQGRNTTIDNNETQQQYEEDGDETEDMYFGQAAVTPNIEKEESEDMSKEAMYLDIVTPKGGDGDEAMYNEQIVITDGNVEEVVSETKGKLMQELNKNLQMRTTKGYTNGTV